MPDKQAKRFYTHYFQRLTVTEIAKKAPYVKPQNLTVIRRIRYHIS